MKMLQRTSKNMTEGGEKTKIKYGTMENVETKIKMKCHLPFTVNTQLSIHGNIVKGLHADL